MLLAWGCNEKIQPTSTVESAPALVAAYRGSLFTHEPLDESLSKLRAAVAPDIEALDFRIFADRLVLQARDPLRRERVVEYRVRDGRVERPVEVLLKGPGDLEDNLFRLADVKLQAIPESCFRALERVDAAAGRISYVLVRRNLPVSTDVQVRVYVASPSRDGYLDTDAQGHPLEDERTGGCQRDAGNSRK